MATVETRETGMKIIRHGPGRQPLLTISEKLQGLIWLSPISGVIRVQRHWDEELDRTEPCRCVGHCPTTRTDRLVAVLLQMDRLMYEERVLVLPEDGWRCMERCWLAKFQDRADLQGAGCLIRRVGSRRNGRTTCEILEWYKSVVPESFDLDEAVRRQMHIATDFFHRGANAHEVDEKIETPIKRRSDKPRVPLGSQRR
jgi:hypothetical protein